MDQKKTEDQEQTKEEFRENEIQDQEDQEDQFGVLDAAIEYKLKGFYPEGLTVDQKCSARRKAKSIPVEHGEVLKRERCALALSYSCTITVCLIHSLTTVAMHCGSRTLLSRQCYEYVLHILIEREPHAAAIGADLLSSIVVLVCTCLRS